MYGLACLVHQLQIDGIEIGCFLSELGWVEKELYLLKSLHLHFDA